MKKFKDPATGATLFVPDAEVERFKAAGYKEAVGRPSKKVEKKADEAE